MPIIPTPSSPNFASGLINPKKPIATCSRSRPISRSSAPCSTSPWICSASPTSTAIFRTAAEQHDRLCGRSGQGYLLLFIDVNNLKTINDTSRHAAGDAALGRVAEILRTTFRASDILGRWGGDKFVVIATSVDDHDTEQIVSRFLENTTQNCYYENSKDQISVSVGSAYRAPEQTQGIDELIAEADAATYHCRDKGRHGGTT